MERRHFLLLLRTVLQSYTKLLLLNFFCLISAILGIESISDKQEMKSLKQDLQQVIKERDSLKGQLKSIETQ